jgi:hypothetical protein
VDAAARTWPQAWSGIARGAAGTVQCELRRADAAQGRLAVISQSRAIVAGMIEWVAQRILAKWWPQARRPAADKTGSGNARLPARLGGLMFALAVRGRLWPPHVVP